VVAIVDSSKWGQVAFATFAKLERIDAVIVNEGAPEGMLAELQARNIQVVLV